MNNPIKDIVAFNQKAGLLEAGYDDFLEDSFTIEESLEKHDNLLNLSSVLGHPSDSPKELSRYIVNCATTETTPLSDLDRLDKACDKVVFAVGAMAKLGLSAQQITKALNIVMKANNQKLSMPKDEHGKLMKPDSFVGPEVELQKLLDER